MSDKPKEHTYQDLPYIGEFLGATLRDQFAMAALTGLLAHIGIVARNAPSDDDLARGSYEFADAMLKAREEKS